MAAKVSGAFLPVQSHGTHARNRFQRPVGCPAYFVFGPAALVEQRRGLETQLGSSQETSCLRLWLCAALCPHD